MRRVSAPDLVGFPTQGQGDDDQVAGGALDQGRARAGPVLADDQVAFPVARDFPIRNVGALQSISRIPVLVAWNRGALTRKRFPSTLAR